MSLARAAKAAIQDAILTFKHYGNGYGFRPLVLDAFGRLGSEADDVLLSIAKRTAEIEDIPEGKANHNLRSRLSFYAVKLTAASLVDRRLKGAGSFFKGVQGVIDPRISSAAPPMVVPRSMDDDGKTASDLKDRSNRMLLSSMQVDGQRVVDGRLFPLVLGPVSAVDGLSTATDTRALLAWVTEHREMLREKLREHGAIMLRGFHEALPSAVEFGTLIEDALGVEPLPYLGGAAPRTNVHRGVFTSNESPPSEPIPFHHEMAQVPTYPHTIAFFCETPAQSGGATPILRSDEVYAALRSMYPDFVDDLEKKGLRYVRVLPDVDDPTSAIGRSWRSTFLTDDRAVAVEKARELGVTLEWLDDGNVRSVSSVLPAVRSFDNGKVFFNSMCAAYTGWRDCRNDPKKAVTFGDGSPLDPILMDATAKLMQDVCVTIPWQRGDDGIDMLSER